LPLITPKLHGIEEIVRDGETGYIVTRSVEDLAFALSRFVELPPPQRAEMGNRARLAAVKYDEPSFVNNWRKFYSDWVAGNTLTDIPASSAHSVGTV
jgi:glycosyltransferase involved in cell wall biosynthesis